MTFVSQVVMARKVRLEISVAKGNAAKDFAGALEPGLKTVETANRRLVKSFAGIGDIAKRAFTDASAHARRFGADLDRVSAKLIANQRLMAAMGRSGGLPGMTANTRAAFANYLGADNARRFAAMSRMGGTPAAGYAQVLAGGFGGGGVGNRVALGGAGGFPGNGNTGPQLAAIYNAINGMHGTLRRGMGHGAGGGHGPGGGGGFSWWGGFGGGGRGGGGFHPLRNIVNLASSIYVFERAMRTLHATFIKPFASGVGHVFNEDSRKFAHSMAGPLNSLGAGWDLNAALVRRSRSSVATVADLREAARTLGFNPSLSARLTFAGGTEQQAGQVARFESLSRRLGVWDPQQAAVNGQVVALRELAEGGEAATRSLRMRFGVTSRMLARQIAGQFGGDMDKALAEIKSNPTAGVTALERLVDAFVSDAAAERAGRLVSVRWAKVKDAFKAGLSDVAEAGVFDDAVDKLQKFQDALFAHLDTPQWESQARRVSSSLGKILDNLSKMVVDFLRQVTGSRGDTSTVSGVVGLAADAIARLATASDALPTLGKNIGSFVHGLGSVIDRAVGQVERLTEAIENFHILQNLYDGGHGDTGTLQREAVFQVLRQHGIRGATTGIAVGTEQRIRAGDLGAEPYTVETRRKVLDLLGVADPEQRKLAFEVAAKVQGLEPRVLTSPARTRDAMGVDLLRRLEAVRTGQGLAPSPLSPPADVPSDVPESVRRLIKAEYGGPAYAAMLKALSSLTGRVEPLAADSALASVVRQGRSVFATNLTGDDANPLTLAGVFGRMRSMYDADVEALRTAVGEGEVVTSPSAHLLKNLGTLRGVRDAMPGQHAEAEQAVRDQLVELGQSYGLAVSANLADLPPFAAAELQRLVSAGATSLGKDVAEVLAKAGMPLVYLAREIGAGSLSLSRQQQLLQQQTDFDLSALEQSGQFGRLRLGMTPAQIRRTFSARPDATRVAGETLSYLRGQALPEQADMVSRLRVAYRENPDEATGEALAKATAGYAALLAKMREAELANNRMLAGMVEFGDAGQRAIEDGLGQALSNLITGVGTAKDAFRSLAQTVIDEFARIQARTLVQSVLGTGGDAGVSGLGGLLGRLFGLGGTGHGSATYSTLPPAGSGGGGNAPLMEFPVSWHARGDVFTGPSIIGVGERKPGEVVMPVTRGPGGYLGVAAYGGGGAPKITNIIVGTEAEADAQAARIRSTSPDVIVNTVRRDMGKNRGIYRKLL